MNYGKLELSRAALHCAGGGLMDAIDKADKFAFSRYDCLEN